jgi:uncharacterized membrane protein
MLTVFLALDFLWLGLVAKKFYTRHLGFLMKKKTNWLAAIIFYLIFVLGLYLFVVQPALAKDSWTHAILFGSIFGLITYSTYDLTNLATIKGWPLKITIADLFWGVSLSALTSAVSFFLITLLF